MFPYHCTFSHTSINSIPIANKNFLLMFFNRISVVRLLVLNLNASCLCFFFKCRGGILNEFYMKEVRLLCGTDKTLEHGKESFN